MKKIILSVAAVMTMVSVSSAGDDFGASLKAGKFSVDARLFYFNRDFDSGSSLEALTAGGILKYVSGDFKGFKVGTALYSSNLVGDTTNRDRGIGSALLQKNPYNTSSYGDNINFVGEAFLQYNFKKNMIKIGRQQLSTPIFNSNDVRDVPTSYEAVILRSKCVANTMIEAGYVVSQTGFGSSYGDFEKVENKWGDNGLAYLYVTNNSIKELKVRAQYVKALSDDFEVGGVTSDILVTDYKYADIKYSLPFGSKTFVSAQFLGNDYNNQDDSMVVGAKAGTSFGIVNVAAVYNQVFDNAYKKIASSSMYTDWQQGYNNFGPSHAYGVIVSAKPMKDLKVMARFVDITGDDYSSDAGANSNKENLKDNFSETNFDATYAFNDWSSLRLRYSIKDQDSKSTLVDRNDFRAIYRIQF